jgi:hypothetical protein
MEFAWKDATVVLFLSTVHDGMYNTLLQSRAEPLMSYIAGQNYVAKYRKRPAATASGYAQTIKMFGDDPRKWLEIPEFIDEYNLWMCGVDIADQLRSYYNTERTHRKTWKPLFSFLLDTIVSNCYQLSTYRTVGERTLRQYSHAQFRRTLRDALFHSSIRVRKQPASEKAKGTMDIVWRPVREHKLHKVFKKQVFCAACKEARRTTSTPHYSARRPLADLSINTTRKQREDSRGWKRPFRSPRTNYGCSVCRIAFCTGARCWNEHLARLNSKD